MKRRVAVFLLGGIGTGGAMEGIPAIHATVRGLARELEIDVYSLSMPDAPFRAEGYSIVSPPRGLSTARLRKLRWPWLASRFLAEHRKRPYDLVFSFWGYPMGLLAVALAKLVRRPSIVALLGAETASVPSIGYGHLLRPLLRALVLRTCAEASAVVVLSTPQRETLRRLGSQAKIEVIPFGVDRALFEPREARLSSPLRVLHVANLTQVKDQATLIRGFALLRRHTDATLRIVGPDHLHGQLQRLAIDLGVHEHVEFLGAVPYARMPAHYAWADMFALTSLYESENVALVEAAMSGALLVSTRVGCIHDMGGEEAAVVVNAGDPADLAAKMQAIAADPEEWERKTAAARAWAERHDLQWTVASMATLIERTCAWT